MRAPSSAKNGVVEVFFPRTAVPLITERAFPCATTTWLEIRVPASIYGWICLIRSSAWRCVALGVVTMSNVGASGLAPGVGQVLRTMLLSSAISVEKLCAGVPSSTVRLATLSRALRRRHRVARGLGRLIDVDVSEHQVAAKPRGYGTPRSTRACTAGCALARDRPCDSGSGAPSGPLSSSFLELRPDVLAFAGAIASRTIVDVGIGLTTALH